MKSREEIMNMLEAFDLTGSLRDAGELAGVSHHTVARYVAERDAGELAGGGPRRRGRIIDPWMGKIEEWVERSDAKIRAERARTDVAGYWPWSEGAARAFGQGRARRGSRLPQAAYEMPILESLIESGGSARSSVVIDRVGAKLEAQLTDIDRGRTPGRGVIRWRNVTQFARHELVKKGQMPRDSPHGVWEISQAGRDRVKAEATT